MFLRDFFGTGFAFSRNSFLNKIQESQNEENI